MPAPYQKWQQSARSLSTSFNECGNPPVEHFPPPLILGKYGAAEELRLFFGFFGEQQQSSADRAKSPIKAKWRVNRPLTWVRALSLSGPPINKNKHLDRPSTTTHSLPQLRTPKSQAKG